MHEDIRPSVEVSRLSKTYEPTPQWMRLLVRSSTSKPVVALDGVSFEVVPGQICAVIGPNGAGKSTLFRVLTGLTTPTSGAVSVLGMDPVNQGHRIRRRIGFMPAEDRTLFLRHTCRENLRFHGRLHGMEERYLLLSVDEVLDMVGLKDARDRVGFALSSGMRARLMLARAILHRPHVLILDEPTGAIDPVSAFNFLELIQQISLERGIATLISSHRVEEIEALRDNVLLLDRGRVVYWGDLGAVRETWERKQYEIEFTDRTSRDSAYHRLAKETEIEVVKVGDRSMGLSAEEDSGLSMSRLAADMHLVRSIETKPMPLRDLLQIVLSQSRPDTRGSD